MLDSLLYKDPAQVGGAMTSFHPTCRVDISANVVGFTCIIYVGLVVPASPNVPTNSGNTDTVTVRSACGIFSVVDCDAGSPKYPEGDHDVKFLTEMFTATLPGITYTDAPAATD